MTVATMRLLRRRVVERCPDCFKRHPISKPCRAIERPAGKPKGHK